MVIIFITPPVASLPYNTEPPPLTISIFSIAPLGISSRLYLPSIFIGTPLSKTKVPTWVPRIIILLVIVPIAAPLNPCDCTVTPKVFCNTSNALLAPLSSIRLTSYTSTAAGVSRSFVSKPCAVTIIGSSVKTCSGSSAYPDVPPQMTLPVINAIIRVFFSKLCFIKFNFLSNFNSLIPFFKYSRKNRNSSFSENR